MTTILGPLYIVPVATVVDDGLWATLMSRHPSSVVAPFSMLVPVLGVLASWLVFAERIPDAVEAAGRRGGHRGRAVRRSAEDRVSRSGSLRRPGWW